MSVRDIELPAAGPYEMVDSHFPAVFNWEYHTDRDDLVRLYEKSKRLQWNATSDIDWAIHHTKH